MRVLLVNPPVYDFSCFDFWLKPLGLLYVASYLKENGHDVELFDFMDRHSPHLDRRLKEKDFGTGNFTKTPAKKPPSLRSYDRPYYRYGVPAEKFMERIHKEKYDWFFVTSMMTYWIEGVSEVLNMIEESQQAGKTMLGGNIPKLLPERASALGADCVFYGGEGEIKGFLNGAGINAETDFCLNDLVPMYGLYRENDAAAVITQRGCPFRCSYCAVHKLNPKFAPLKREAVYRTLEYLEGLGVRNITFYDDALLYDRENHFIPIAEEIIRKKHPFTFHYSNGIHSRFIDEKTAQLIGGMNPGIVALSVETASERLMNSIGGKAKRSHVETAVKNLESAGVERGNIYAYMMIGLDEENLDDIILTIDYLKSLEVRILINEFSPVPTTQDYESKRQFLSDPLLTNNSVYTSLFKYDFETVQSIKNMVKRANRENYEKHKRKS